MNGKLKMPGNRENVLFFVLWDYSLDTGIGKQYLLKKLIKWDNFIIFDNSMERVRTNSLFSLCPR